MSRRIAIAFILALAAAAVYGAGSRQESKGEPIVVGSKIDTEGSLLGSMIFLRLSRAGLPVEDRTEFGTTDVVRKAITAGELSIYPEYTGNGGFFFSGTDSAVWKDRVKAWETVKKLDGERNGLVWLAPAPANNTWAIAVTKAVADGAGLKTLQDLSAYLGRGGVFKLAGSEEFVTRPDALPAFEKAYGFSLRKDQLLVLSGGNTATTEQAAARGTDGVNAAMAYGTDGQLAALGLVVLADSLGVQPVYEPAPLVRADVLSRYPQIATLLEPVFAKLDLVTLQTLNARIAVEGQDPKVVAGTWLREQGLAE